jgi:hypothetical protein
MKPPRRQPALAIDYTAHECSPLLVLLSRGSFVRNIIIGLAFIRGSLLSRGSFVRNIIIGLAFIRGSLRWLTCVLCGSYPFFAVPLFAFFAVPFLFFRLHLGVGLLAPL